MKYRKKPVTVDAWRIEIGPKPPYWVQHEFFGGGRLEPVDRTKGFDWNVIVHTNEGDLNARPGDWLIRAEDGRVWPTDHEYFTKNYEEVADEDN